MALIHLNHPLLQRAIGVFRARVWQQDDSALHRVSYRVLADPHLRRPVVLAYGRLVAVGSLTQRLHETIVAVGGEIDGNQVAPLEPEDLRRMLAQPYEHPTIPVRLGDRLRDLAPSHRKALERLLREEEARQRQRLEDLASQRAEEDAAAIGALMDERIKELQQRIRTTQRGPNPRFGIPSSTFRPGRVSSI
jgi:hypothetical protein